MSGSGETLRWLWLVLAACGNAPDMAAGLDAPMGSSDSSIMIDGAPDGADAAVGTYRSSLAICWTDASCARAMAVAHGGSWNTSSAPYLSNAALEAAFAAGDEGVKIDVRITQDGVPVLAHSSPIELFESFDCANKKIENMTAAQVTACHRAPSSTQTFQRLDDVLNYLRGKMVAQLCVKRPVDFAAAIAAVHALNAEDFAFIEINTTEYINLAPTLPGTSGVQFMVNVKSQLADIDSVLAVASPKTFMIEIDPGVEIGTLVEDRLHPAGVRAFIYDDAASPTVAQLKAHYQAGFDVVSSQSGPKGVEARIARNQALGVTPP